MQKNWLTAASPVALPSKLSTYQLNPAHSSHVTFLNAVERVGIVLLLCQCSVVVKPLSCQFRDSIVLESCRCRASVVSVSCNQESCWCREGVVLGSHRWRIPFIYPRDPVIIDTAYFQLYFWWIFFHFWQQIYLVWLYIASEVNNSFKSIFNEYFEIFLLVSVYFNIAPIFETIKFRR